MKQIRHGVFETNSSSTHSLTMCLESEYDKWINGEALLFVGSNYGFKEGHKPERNHFYTRKEAIDFMKFSYYCPEDINWEDKEEVDDFLNENEFRTYENYDDDYLEWFEDTYTTPSGEIVVAFGQFGYVG